MFLVFLEKCFIKLHFPFLHHLHTWYTCPLVKCKLPNLFIIYLSRYTGRDGTAHTPLPHRLGGVAGPLYTRAVFIRSLLTARRFLISNTHHGAIMRGRFVPYHFGARGTHVPRSFLLT